MGLSFQGWKEIGGLILSRVNYIQPVVVPMSFVAIAHEADRQYRNPVREGFQGKSLTLESREFLMPADSRPKGALSRGLERVLGDSLQSKGQSMELGISSGPFDCNHGDKISRRRVALEENIIHCPPGGSVVTSILSQGPEHLARLSHRQANRRSPSALEPFPISD